MLSPDIIKKIKKTHIRSSRLVNSLMAGQYKAVFRGSGIEFEEVREYTPGDEVKSIDWKVSARMGRPFVKRYREERELIIMLLVDMSASNQFGTTERLKVDTAAETASILAFNAIRNNDKVGAILFTDRIEKYIPPKKGSSHVWRVIAEIYGFTPHGTGTDLAEAIRYLGRMCRKKSVVFLISDFLAPVPNTTTALRPKSDVLRQLAVTSKKHELIAVVLDDPGEYHLPAGGMLAMRDLESGRLLYLDSGHDTMRQAYSRIKRLERQNILTALNSVDIDTISITTHEETADALTRYFRYREKRKR